jgi:hypothetical protein
MWESYADAIAKKPDMHAAGKLTSPVEKTVTMYNVIGRPIV